MLFVRKCLKYNRYWYISKCLTENPTESTTVVRSIRCQISNEDICSTNTGILNLFGSIAPLIARMKPMLVPERSKFTRLSIRYTLTLHTSVLDSSTQCDAVLPFCPFARCCARRLKVGRAERGGGSRSWWWLLGAFTPRGEAKKTPSTLCLVSRN